MLGVLQLLAVVATATAAHGARVTGVGLVSDMDYAAVGQASAALFCAYELEAEEHDFARVVWLKAGEVLQQAPDTGSSKSRLELSNLQRSHNGHYTCKVDFPDTEEYVGDQKSYELLVIEDSVQPMVTHHSVHGTKHDGKMHFTVNRSATFPPEFAFCGLTDLTGHWIQGPDAYLTELDKKLSFSSKREEWTRFTDDEGRTSFSLTDQIIEMSDVPEEYQNGALLGKCEWRAMTEHGQDLRDYRMAIEAEIFPHYECPPEPLIAGKGKEHVTLVYGEHNVLENGWWASYHDMASEMVCAPSGEAYTVSCDAPSRQWRHNDAELQKADLNQFVDTCSDQCRIAPLSLLVAACALLAAATN